MLIDTVIAFDHKLRKTFIISCPAAGEIITGYKGSIKNWGAYYDKACEKINKLHRKIYSKTSTDSENTDNLKTSVKIRHEMGKKDYMNIVKTTKEYIRAGDIFQANLSQRVSADIGATNPWQIYKVLSGINPSPFAGYLNMGNYCIASSSPERLVRVAGNRVETRPIAGTRPRGANEEGDRLMRTDLLLNEKERAEHLMLIDLERNDLGRISDYSTVEVDEIMITEDYSHVIHIVSNIKGTIVKGRDCFDAIRATFPGGTITGVPKVRCMEIIDELEPVVRGPYTGSIGYISFTGAMDLNIIIRTFVIKNQIAYVQAGAGIVADSDPEREYYETLKKAEALIKTLEVL
jgi:anthranilate/para-aminobenzoate synthase component I